MAFCGIIITVKKMFSNELVCNILDYINKNINKEITIDELSSILYFNKTYIMKRFKKDIGLTIIEYINCIRIFNSLYLYTYNNHIISIAFKSGFNSLEYYSEIFKKVIGVSPTTYKKYINRNINITKKDINTILNSIARLNRIIIETEKYISNRKPASKMVKKFIFK